MASVAYREPISATVGKRMILTGPDYKKDHLPHIQQHTSYVGEKPRAWEQTGDVGYLWRPASHGSLPARHRHAYVGEVGWGIPECDFINKTRRESGFHIQVALSHHSARQPCSLNPSGIECEPYDLSPNSWHTQKLVWFDTSFSTSRTDSWQQEPFGVCYSAQEDDMFDSDCRAPVTGSPAGAHKDNRQPKPCIMDMLGRFSRGRIAWNMGDYENISERNSTGATLVRQNKTALPGASRPPKLPKPPKKEKVRQSLRPPPELMRAQVAFFTSPFVKSKLRLGI
ncbi:protein SPMIP2 [Molossus nigricans]